MSTKSAYGTAVVSISLPVDFIMSLEDEAKVHNQKRSQWMRYLLRMGRVYVRTLEEQQQSTEK